MKLSTFFEKGSVEHHRCGICDEPVGYRVHETHAAIVFDSSCGCSVMRGDNLRLATRQEIEDLPE